MKGISLNARMHRIWGAYERQLSRRPVLTQMATSCVLWGCGDIIAQRVVEQRRLSEVDARRAVCTAAFGAAFMGPVGHFWYQQLDIVCGKLMAAGSPGFLATKLIADTLIMGPLYVVAFYAWGCALIDGSGFEGFKKKIVQDFIPTYTAELAVWPLFQAFNFTRVPVEHQLLAVNGATLVDACFLSWARSQDDWVATAMSALRVLWQDGGDKLPPAVAAVAAVTATGPVSGGGNGGGASGAAQRLPPPPQDGSKTVL